VPDGTDRASARIEEAGRVSTVDLIEQLNRGWLALRALQPRVEAGAPWPLSDRFGNEPEAYWYPPEVLAHVSELLERWLGVVNQIVAGGPEPVPFGQAGPNPARLEGIERNRHLPLPDLYARIGEGVAGVTSRLAELSEADIAKRGIHPSRGETTVGEILGDSVAGHVDEHVRQLEELLTAARR